MSEWRVIGFRHRGSVFGFHGLGARARVEGLLKTSKAVRGSPGCWICSVRFHVALFVTKSAS